MRTRTQRWLENEWIKIVSRAVNRWLCNDGSGLAGAVSFYALFALAPLLVFSLVVVSKFVGYDEAKEATIEWLNGTLTRAQATNLVDILKLDFPSGHWLTSVVSGLTLAWAMSLIFVRLRTGVRQIFEEPPAHWKAILKSSLFGRLVSLGLVLFNGILVSLGLISIAAPVPIGHLLHIDQQIMLEFITIFILCLEGGLLLWLAPRAKPDYRSVAVSIAVFFLSLAVGRLILAVYISHSLIANAYGVASAIVIFLIWIYYAACTYFVCAALCAELSRNRNQGAIND